MSRTIRYEVLNAPRDDGEILIEPSPADVLDAARRGLPDNAAAARIGDTTIGALRDSLRAGLGLSGPVVIAGHQAEFIHAGVFAKNIAADAIVRTIGGVATFLTVDTDVPKSTRLIVPRVAQGILTRSEFELPGADPRRDQQHQQPAPRRQWAELFERVAHALPGAANSLLSRYAIAFLDTSPEHLDFCAAIERGRVALESAIGLTPLREQRMSALCDTPEFAAFATHVLRHAARVAETYNAAQRDFRQRHAVRSPGRPVPPLVTTDGRVEAPFWIVEPSGARHRLFVAGSGDEFEVFAEGERLGQFRSVCKLGTPCDPAARWLIRPRALTLAAFARLFLADLFIHGIGGAKYDEITKAWIAGWLGISLAPACCITATLRLDLPRTGATSDALRAASRASRDVRYNPQRYVRFVDADLLQRRVALIDQSSALRTQHSRDRTLRRRVLRDIHDVNAALLRADNWKPAELDQRVAELRRQLEIDRIANDREYCAAFHRSEKLSALAMRLRQALAR